MNLIRRARQIGQTVQGVHNPAQRICIKRIHRKIPAAGVIGNVIGKGHNRTAAVCFDISPKGGDFKRFATLRQPSQCHGQCRLGSPSCLHLRPIA